MLEDYKRLLGRGNALEGLFYAGRGRQMEL